MPTGPLICSACVVRGRTDLLRRDDFPDPEKESLSARNRALFLATDERFGNDASMLHLYAGIPARSTRFIKVIGRVSAAKTRTKPRVAERRQRLRRRYGARILTCALALEQSPGVEPKRLLGNGPTYLRVQWPTPIRYVETAVSQTATFPVEPRSAHSAWGVARRSSQTP